ncbi:hypothetical protein NEMBOFW57_000724 [Staphylotrichum longicolle]|uniref:Uncharacterized protein n=1 Tax=Staphylotrichum longicolle TaxID=669026 RepID=A0AAD4F0B5_9PEZI|nr:hypothetical protein NEMBOFW57_000724 [Staphylotrichum longicolle]
MWTPKRSTSEGLFGPPCPKPTREDKRELVLAATRAMLSLQGRISQDLWEHLRAQVVREAEVAVKDDEELAAAIGHCLPRRD